MTYSILNVIPYNGGWGGPMSCDFLVMSEAGVKLYHHRHTEMLEIKTSLSSAGNIKPASYVTGQFSHLSTGISYSWVEWFYSVQCRVKSKELEMTEMLIWLLNKYSQSHMLDSCDRYLAKVLEEFQESTIM